MLSSLTRRYLIIASYLIWIGGGSPTHFYNFKHGKPPSVTIRSTSRIRRFYEFANKFIDIFYIAFVAYQLMSQRRQGAPLFAVVQTTYVLTGYTLSVVLDFQAVLRGDVTANFIAEYMKVFKDIEDKYAQTGRSKKEPLVKCNTFLNILFIFGHLIYLQNFLLMLKKPHTPHFFTSILNEEDMKRKKGLKLLLILAQSWVWFNLWSNIYFYIFPIYVYISGGIRILKELNPRFKGHQTISKLRERKHFIQTINMLRVLHAVFIDTYRTWVQPTQKSVTMAIACLAIYGVVRLDGRQARIMAFAATFCLLYLGSVYRRQGLLFETSVKLRQTWLYDNQGQASSKWMHKYMTSVPEFRIFVGDYYYVNKTTVVTILYTILNGTITLLLG